MLYCVFPLESSAKHNKKAVQCTAIFVISATFCDQVPTVADTTKATLLSGFLVALCARDSGGIRTHDPQLRRLLLYPTELRNQAVMCDANIVYFAPKRCKSNTFFPICKNSLKNSLKLTQKLACRNRKNRKIVCLNYSSVQHSIS